MAAGWNVRPYRHDADLAGINRVRAAVREVEGGCWMPGPDSSDITDAHLAHGLVVEADGEIVAYTWMLWWNEASDIRLYLLLGWVDPAWRRQGIGTDLIRRQLAQAAALAATEDGIPILGGNAGETQDATRDLLLRHGFTLAFTTVQMQADLTDQHAAKPAGISLPDGVAVRPVQPDHYPQIHEFIELCFRENRFGFESMTFDEFHQTEVEGKDLDLWHVAWRGDQIVALVISEIDDDGESDTPWVAVHPAWRRRGLAWTLLSDSLAQLAARGVRKAAIATVAENQNDTLGLYRSAGFEVVSRGPRYRRPCEPMVAS